MTARSRLIAVLSLSLLLIGLVIDLTTPRELVVAIIYNIPIALSSLALSRRLTVSVLLLAFGANIAAGYVNALGYGGLALFTLLNRSLAGLSFLLVGVLTLALRRAAAGVARLQLEGARAGREEALRRFLSEVSRALYPEALLKTAARSLQLLLDADEVVISALDGATFAEPRYASPPNAVSAQGGASARWAADVLPLKVPVAGLRREDGVTVVARLSAQQDYLVVALRPRAAAPKILLAEAAEGTEPLLLRAEELARLARPVVTDAPG